MWVSLSITPGKHWFWAKLRAACCTANCSSFNWKFICSFSAYRYLANLTQILELNFVMLVEIE
jgi:hypothetical protein